MPEHALHSPNQGDTSEARPALKTSGFSQERLARMPEQKAASPFFEGFWGERGWDLGVSMITRRGDLAGVPGRFGWDGAFGTSWYVDPKEEMVGVFMSQRTPDTLSLPAAVLDFWPSAYQLLDD